MKTTTKKIMLALGRIANSLEKDQVRVAENVSQAGGLKKFRVVFGTLWPKLTMAKIKQLSKQAEEQYIKEFKKPALIDYAIYDLNGGDVIRCEDYEVIEEVKLFYGEFADTRPIVVDAVITDLNGNDEICVPLFEVV